MLFRKFKKMFRTLKNKLKCFFCRKSCDLKYHVGNHGYYSGFGYISNDCPKEMRKRYPFYGMSVKEIRKYMQNLNTNEHDKEEQ